MKVLKLTATIEEGEWKEPYNVCASVHVEPGPGQFGVMQLGAAGLTLRIGQQVAGIRLEELVAALLPAIGEAPAGPRQGPSVAPEPDTPISRVKAATGKSGRNKRGLE